MTPSTGETTLGPGALVQCSSTPAIVRQSVLVGVPSKISPMRALVARPPGTTSVPIHLSRVVQARELQSRIRPTNQPTAEEEAADQEQDDRGPFFGSATGRELVLRLGFGRDDRLGLAELVENGECLGIRRTRVDRLGQVPFDLGEQFPQPPGRETASGAAQALQVLGGERVQGVGRHLSTPFASRASTESRNRVHSITKPPSAAWPSGVRR